MGDQYGGRPRRVEEGGSAAVGAIGDFFEKVWGPRCGRGSQESRRGWRCERLWLARCG